MTYLSLSPQDTVSVNCSFRIGFSEPVVTPAGIDSDPSYFVQIIPETLAADTISGDTLYSDVLDSTIIPWRKVVLNQAEDTLTVVNSNDSGKALLKPGKTYRFCFGGFPHKIPGRRNMNRIFLQDTAGNPLISRQGLFDDLVDSATGIYPEDLFRVISNTDTFWVLPLDTSVIFYTK